MTERSPLTEELIARAMKLLRLDPDNIRDAREYPNNSRVGRAMWLTIGKGILIDEAGRENVYLYEEAVQEALHRLDAEGPP